ncbi:MAG: lysine--tRNA ligase [bacterium]|nr:lysine--tRNA ligase [bacterium]
MPERKSQHWADRIVDQILAQPHPEDHVYHIVTGITPSGRIHIGNLREVLTADVIYRILQERGKKAKLFYVADDYDPLRKVYPFLDPQKYQKFVGHPLSDIPCPCDQHPSYAEHFLEPFLASMSQLKIDLTVLRASELYKGGRYNQVIIQALEARDTIAEILFRLTGKEIDEFWSPFVPICESCGSMAETKVIGWDRERELVGYLCQQCQNQGWVPVQGHGKLTWRVDWPARWSFLNVDIEPMGKDHGSKGGSYDTGQEIVRRVFHKEPPFPIVYEWIRLEGMGDMSSSKGNVVAIEDVLKVVPADVLRYLIIKALPKQRINFDPVNQLLNVFDEVDNEQAKYRDPRSLELSLASGFVPIKVPFNHLISIVQIAGGDPARVSAILKRGGYQIPESSAKELEERCRYALNWLEHFAPAEYRFSVAESIPQSVQSLTPSQRRVLGKLSDLLSTMLSQKEEKDISAEEIHRSFYEAAQQEKDLSIKEVFQAFYTALIDKEHGPRAGWFVKTIGVEFVQKRLAEASAIEA